VAIPEIASVAPLPRNDTSLSVIASEAKQSPSFVTASPSVSEGVAVSGDCFVATAPRNDEEGKTRNEGKRKPCNDLWFGLLQHFVLRNDTQGDGHCERAEGERGNLI